MNPQNESINQKDCIFCTEAKDEEEISNTMNIALINKYSLHQNYQLLQSINGLLTSEDQDNCKNKESILFKQIQLWDQNYQYFKKNYNLNQMNDKMITLLEYYKYHRDVPRIHTKYTQQILEKYHNRKRQNQYKKIKIILKRQQGVDISSLKSSSKSFSSNSNTQKSKYSDILSIAAPFPNSFKMFQENSDSCILKEICEEIDTKYPGQQNYKFTGAFYFSEKHFENFIKREEQKRKQRLQNCKKKSKKIIIKQIPSFKKVKQFNTQSQSLKRQKQKSNKFIYNTNIKIQIRNSLFFSQPIQQQNFQQNFKRFQTIVNNKKHKIGQKQRSKLYRDLKTQHFNPESQQKKILSANHFTEDIRAFSTSQKIFKNIDKLKPKIKIISQKSQNKNSNYPTFKLFLLQQKKQEEHEKLGINSKKSSLGQFKSQKKYAKLENRKNSIQQLLNKKLTIHER